MIAVYDVIIDFLIFTGFGAFCMSDCGKLQYRLPNFTFSFL